jgi:prephenate dehydrogenase
LQNTVLVCWNLAFALVFFFNHPILATKMYAVVAGQTSVKAPEKAAFEKHLPEDVHIVSCHSLHGPTVSPLGQPLVSITSSRYNKLK